MTGPTNECPDCGHANHDPEVMGRCTVIWMGERCDCGEPEYVSRCPACGDPIDYCQGHGEIGDPAGRAILDAHDEGHHHGCHPDGCDEARAENDWKTWRNAWIPGGE